MTNAKENQLKPGPGNYQGDPSKTIKSAPSYGFGSSVRANTVDNKKKTEPGPGAYVQHFCY